MAEPKMTNSQANRYAKNDLPHDPDAGKIGHAACPCADCCRDQELLDEAAMEGDGF